MNPGLLWCDGQVLDQAQARVSPLDRTLLYGLGAFETLRLHGGRPFLLQRHLQRLRASLARLDLPLPGALGDLAAGLPELARRQGQTQGLARVTVTAGPERAPGPDAAVGMHVYALLRPLPRREPGVPVRVGLAAFAHDLRSPIVGVKSTSYLVHYLLRDRALRAGRQDDLMVDAQGRVTEGTVSSVFVVSGGRLRTPPVSEGILPGITRGLVLELARAEQLPTEESPLTLDDLRSADECFLTGAGNGVALVDELDGRRLPAERPVGEVLRRAWAGRVAAECGVEPAEVLG